MLTSFFQKAEARRIGTEINRPDTRHLCRAELAPAAPRNGVSVWRDCCLCLRDLSSAKGLLTQTGFGLSRSSGTNSPTGRANGGGAATVRMLNSHLPEGAKAVIEHYSLRQISSQRNSWSSEAASKFV